ncbi:hypothetical protein CAEBREN_15313 [Caenorhabditis brenneri]|uniref:Serpentine receptor class gamma n=1 Tax=Caenorhabditis brenneri TaxID=135651 RepID=G0N1E4_CAEBE|nr:hypothetical protein CAEBREN_15313 [Caenorhabditis brenneri]
MNVIAGVNKMFMSYLAIQRFILYFWPDLSLCDTHRSIWSTYSVFSLYQTAKPVSQFFLKNNPGLKLLPFFFFGEDLFLIFATALYVPVFWSIRKLKHLPSAKLNNPHRYVLWQLLATVAYKILFTIPSMVLQDIIMTERITGLQTLDYFAIPIISQVTYLGCNRRNRREFIKEVSKRLWFKILCGRCCSKKKSTVEPTPDAIVQLSVMERI